MDDLTSKINEIMSDPEKLKEIQNLGKMMGLNTDENSNSSNTNNQNVLPMNSPNKSQNNNSLGPLGDFGGIDPSIIGKLAPIFSSINKEDDTTRLFDAMIPFLSRFVLGVVSWMKWKGKHFAEQKKCEVLSTQTEMYIKKVQNQSLRKQLLMKIKVVKNLRIRRLVYLNKVKINLKKSKVIFLILC